MDKPRYTLDIVIAAPGTPLIDLETGKQQVLDGVPQTSAPGHMFYVLHAPGQSPKSFGFAPKEHGSMNGPGAIMEDDADVYKDPRHTRTLEISEAQYRKLEAFGSDPEKFGFSKHYEDVRHNCVDFTWEALNHAGIERKRSIDVNALGGPAGQLSRMSAFLWTSTAGARTVIVRCVTSTASTASIRRSPTAISTVRKPTRCRIVRGSSGC